MFTIPDGEDLRKLRKKAGLTQTELADKSGLSQSLIARIESSSVDPRLSTLKKIFDAIEETMKIKKTVIDLLNFKQREHSKLPNLIAVSPNQKVTDAINLMNKYSISQLPVLDDGKSIGSVIEDTLLEKSLKQNKDISEIYISEVMDKPFPLLNNNSKLEDARKLFTQGSDAILIIGLDGNFSGILTKIDLISYTSI